MDYKEALKTVSTQKARENFMLIEFQWDKKIVLPYKDGLALVGCLANAELLNEQYSKPKTITGIERDSFKTTILSRDEYELIKISHLLGLTLEEVQEQAKQPS